MTQRITWKNCLGIILFENLISVTQKHMFGITFATISGWGVFLSVTKISPLKSEGYGLVRISQIVEGIIVNESQLMARGQEQTEDLESLGLSDSQTLRLVNTLNHEVRALKVYVLHVDY